MAAVREQSALYRVSFACVHRVLREVCVRFRYLLPFPSLSHRFDHEIREDRATQEVNPSIIITTPSINDDLSFECVLVGFDPWITC